MLGASTLTIFSMVEGQCRWFPHQQLLSPVISSDVASLERSAHFRAWNQATCLSTSLGTLSFESMDVGDQILELSSGGFKARPAPFDIAAGFILFRINQVTVAPVPGLELAKGDQILVVPHCLVETMPGGKGISDMSSGAVEGKGTSSLVAAYVEEPLISHSSSGTCMVFRPDLVFMGY